MTSQKGRPSLHQISVSSGGLPKLPVPKARITTEGVEGDGHRNTLLHGGPDRAVCLFSLELIDALRAEGHPIQPGSTGENLTLAGVDWAGLVPGSRIAVGNEVRLEIMSYTVPCSLNTCYFDAGNFKRMSQDLHPGWSRLYAKVLAEGAVCVGDTVAVEEA